MFKIHELREIIRLIDQTSIHEFELESEGTKICIKKEPKMLSQVVTAPVQAIAAAPAAVQTNASPALPVQEAASKPFKQSESKAEHVVSEEENYHSIVSPMVGTFYSKPEPDADPFVKPGDTVNSDTIVCILEAMKLFNEIEAEVSGEIVKMLVSDGQLVEYGQPLFLVKQA